MNLTTFQNEASNFYKWGSYAIIKRKLQWESKSPSEVGNCSIADDDLRSFDRNVKKKINSRNNTIYIQAITR